MPGRHRNSRHLSHVRRTKKDTANMQGLTMLRREKHPRNERNSSKTKNGNTGDFCIHLKARCASELIRLEHAFILSNINRLELEQKTRKPKTDETELPVLQMRRSIVPVQSITERPELQIAPRKMTIRCQAIFTSWWRRWSGKWKRTSSSQSTLSQSSDFCQRSTLPVTETTSTKGHPCVYSTTV